MRAAVLEQQVCFAVHNKECGSPSGFVVEDFRHTVNGINVLRMDFENIAVFSANHPHFPKNVLHRLNPLVLYMWFWHYYSTHE